MGIVLFLLAPLLQAPTLSLPAFTAYPDPAPDGAQVADDGTITNWSSPATRIEWGGYLANSGKIHVTATLSLPQGENATYDLKSGSTTLHADVHGSGPGTIADFGTLNAKSGWVKLYLQGLDRTGASFGTLQNLQLEGPATDGAKFNLQTRRNAASVHLFYPVGEDTEWFYNEVTGVEDPLDTYYMACGFSRGYFGMQVNGPGERRIIFSIWDAGNEGVDRNKVAPENQVQLLAKGQDVFASGFGNEGTGGHSHLVYPWKTGKPQKFLVHAQPNGDHTIFTAYFQSSEDSDWRLIACFSAPHDGKLMSGLYSFVEDFNGDNGNLLRKALYGPAWIWSKARGWEPLVSARFSHDGTGGKDRFDYDFGIKDGKYFLQNGGFEGGSPKAGELIRPPETPKEAPKVDFNALENLVAVKGSNRKR